jgi:UDP-N-acetylmuramoyl-L-alanyl-D-glutamate--2,6-diaminopimelate ligase
MWKVSAVRLWQLLRDIRSMHPHADVPLLSEDAAVVAVEHDSRKVRPGAIFVCIEGQHSDGHRYAAAARRAGALLVIGERDLPASEGPLPYLRVEDSRKALALLSCAFYNHPSHALELVGVTGTNGKTSVTYMIDAIFRAGGRASAVLGTLGSGILSPEPSATQPATDAGPHLPPGDGAPFRPAIHTTPEANDLQGELARWRDHGVQAGAMEVSSHALAQRRSFGTRFRGAVFTNLSPDHLDFHRTMDEYLGTKNLLFRREERGPEEPSLVAVINADDPAAERILEGSDDLVVRFGRGPDRDAHPVSVEMSPAGIRLRLAWGGGIQGRGPSDAPIEPIPAGEFEVNSPLLGEFQVENLLAAAATGLALGLKPAAVAAGLASLRSVPGRMERIDQGQGFAVLIDYAHTPDALRRALSSLRPFTPGRVLLVFGCGGDRDRAKRALMGGEAARGADWIVVTDDNPRGEDPGEIRQEVRLGLARAGATCLEEGDREAAIAMALREARPGDTVLIAGKGHETTQERGGVFRPFDDREVAARLLRGISR